MSVNHTCQYKNELYDFTCNEPAIDTEIKLCIFHDINYLKGDNYEKHRKEVAKRFEQKLSEYSSNNMPLKFIGYCLPSISFEDKPISKDLHVDQAKFYGKVAFDNASFHEEVTFDDATFYEVASFDSAEFYGESYFMRCTFSKKATFQSATFRNVANFNSATFSEGANFLSTKFSETASFFNSAKFLGQGCSMC